MEGMDFRKIGAWLSPSDVVVSWLRLQTPKDCIPQPWHRHICKVFEQLEMLWVGIWVHTYAILHVLVGVNIRKNGAWLILYDVLVSWLRRQTPIDCIPHPYWMYTNCLSTMR